MFRVNRSGGQVSQKEVADIGRLQIEHHLDKLTDPMRRVWFSAVVIAAARRSLATAARTGETTRPNDAGGYTGTERKLESSSDGSGQGEKVVVSGVLELLSTTARGACNLSCTGGIAAAFGTEEDSVACVCPHDANSTRRLHETLRSFERVLLLSPGSPEETSPLPVRHLRGLVELEESAKAAFAVRIQDVSDGGADALGQLSTTGLREVASTFGVQESEVGRMLHTSRHVFLEPRQCYVLFLLRSIVF